MKTPLQSKTLWFAALVAVLGVWDQLSPFIPVDLYPKLMTILGPVIAFLRLITKAPIVPAKPEDEGE